MYVIALVTCPNKRHAAKLSKLILGKKLAACVNIVPGITSIYRWKGRIEKSAEVLLIIKTKESLVSRLGKLVKENHPYELNEFITLPAGGSKEYLDWVGKETAG
jgi:periplasmic divalent cation tolerance protein